MANFLSFFIHFITKLPCDIHRSYKAVTFNKVCCDGARAIKEQLLNLTEKSDISLWLVAKTYEPYKHDT